MTISTRYIRSSLTLTCLAGAIVLCAAGAASAQARAAAPAAALDARWQPWLGCWVPATAPAIAMADAGNAQVCVVPGEAPASVDIVSLTEGKMISREHIEATGARRDTTQDGCKGWESAEWSKDSRRLYLDASFTCEGDTVRSSTAVFGMSLKGDWLDIRSVTVGGNTGVRVLRYRPGTVTGSGLPADVISRLRTQSASTATMRTPLASRVTFEDIADVARHVNVGVAQAWLNELGQTFTISKTDLVALAGAGVPDRIIDLMVAMAYPQAFAVEASRLTAASDRRTDRAPVTTDCARPRVPLANPYECSWSTAMPYGYGYRYGYGSPYIYDPYFSYGAYTAGYGRYGYSPYGYSPYDYGIWYGGNEPIRITPSDGGAATATHGQVVNGRGYTQGRASDASAGSSTSSSSSGAADSGGSSSSNSNSSSGSSSSSSGSSSGGSSSSGGEARTAHPR